MEAMVLDVMALWVSGGAVGEQSRLRCPAGESRGRGGTARRAAERQEHGFAACPLCDGLSSVVGRRWPD